MKKQNLLLLSLITIIFASGLVACGPRKVENAATSGASNFSSTTPTTTTPTSSKPMANCSKDTDNKSNIGMNAMATNNKSVLRAKITKFMTEYDSTDNSVLRCYSYTYSSSGSATAEGPLSFTVEYKNQSGNITTLADNSGNFQFTELNENKIKELVQKAGITYSGSLNALTRDFSLKLSLPDPAADLISLAVYVGQSTEYTHRTNLLKPQFYASPIEYNLTSRPAVLKNIHPLKSMISGGYSAEDYLAASSEFCF